MLQSQKWEQRQEKILMRLDSLRYATRKQLQYLEQLGGDKNAHRILFRMEKEKVIQSIRTDCKVYYLTNRGKDCIASSKDIPKGGRVEHTIMRNDLYIMLQMPLDWMIERPIKLSGEHLLTCDALFKRNGEMHFVEIDHRQSMRNNFDKLDKYARFKKAVWHNEKKHINVIFYTTTAHRQKTLEDYMKAKGIKGKVYKK